MASLSAPNTVVRGIDLGRWDTSKATNIIDGQSGSSLTWRFGDNQLRATGPYQFNLDDGMTSGRVTGVSIRVLNKAVVNITGLDLSATDFQTKAQTLSGDSFFAYLLSGDDLLTGAANAAAARPGFRDVLNGYGGDDTIRGGAGNDTLLGDSGNDRLVGGDGADVLRGGTDNDQLFGKFGSDQLDGGTGNDLMQGGGGDDTVIGGLGNDTLMGSVGDDTFVFAGNFGRDRIRDLTSDDRIQIDSGLIGQAETAAQVVQAFGASVDGNVVLDFGDATITINDFALNQLAARIEII